jgi:hydrogenase maturation protein HypF
MSFARTEEGLVFDQLSLFRDIYLCYNTKDIEEGAIALGFHLAIIKVIVNAILELKEQTGINNVCLSGGVFNNRILLSRSIDALKERGFEVYWNQKVPLGDGGISLGQAYYALLLKSAEHDDN